MSPVRPFYWSLKRELWENRAIFIAPLAAAGVVLAGYLMGSFALPGAARKAMASAKAAAALEGPFSFAVFTVLMISLVVAVFYCLSALTGEQRDRSLLFWKSLPVSDLTAVLAKATVPMALIPVVVFAVAVAVQLLMLVWGSIVLLLANISPAILWTQAPLPVNALVLAYVLIALSLWQAPLWAWLLLASAWARRNAVLWGFGPPLALAAFVSMVTASDKGFRMLGYRLMGGITEAFATKGRGAKAGVDFQHVDPAGFAANPDLWLGLIAAAALLAAAVWLRRHREPN